MRILFDHCVDRRLKRHLATHFIATARDMGWDQLQNGQLLDEAQDQFDVLLTVDQNLRHQQSVSNRPIAVVVLHSGKCTLPELIPLLPKLEACLMSIQPGQIYDVTSP